MLKFTYFHIFFLTSFRSRNLFSSKSSSTSFLCSFLDGFRTIFSSLNRESEGIGFGSSIVVLICEVCFSEDFRLSSAVDLFNAEISSGFTDDFRFPSPGSLLDEDNSSGLTEDLRRSSTTAVSFFVASDAFAILFFFF